MSADCIIAGAGLAGGLIAWRLKQLHPHLKVVAVDAGGTAGGNHTWSCFAHDLNDQQSAWLKPFVDYRWDAYSVNFEKYQRNLALPYVTLTSATFHRNIQLALGSDLVLGAAITDVRRGAVTLADGRVIEATWVIDARGWDESQTVLLTALQSFCGQEWEFAEPHRLTAPVLMDATVPQDGGFRFMYVLPFDATHALIEDTLYHDGSTRFDPASGSANIANYAQQKGWQLQRLLREERGALPIVLSGDLDGALNGTQPGVVPVGVRANRFHPVTGYSLRHAVAVADFVSSKWPMSCDELRMLTDALTRQLWKEQSFFRLLNRMMIKGAPSSERHKIMAKFYGLPECLIARFYAEQLSLLDKMRIVSGKPPISVFEAVRCLGG